VINRYEHSDTYSKQSHSHLVNYFHVLSFRVDQDIEIVSISQYFVNIDIETKILISAHH